MILDQARGSTVTKNFLEYLNTTTTLTSGIHLSSGITGNITSNIVTVPSSIHWLHVTGIYNNISAYGNCSYGVQIGTALFDNGNSLYSVTVPSQLVHYGNCQGDQGWPFNSSNGLDLVTVAKVEATYSPNLPGLTGNGYGTSEIPLNSSFVLPINGSSSANYLEFTLNRLPAPTGTFDISLHAWYGASGGEATCQLEDSGSLVGSPVSQALTAAGAWYTLGTDQAVSASLGVRCWNTSSSQVSYFNLLNVVDH